MNAQEHGCVCVERLGGLCFSFTGGSVHLFVFLVLSPSCVKGWLGDALGGGKWSNKLVSAVSVTLSPVRVPLFLSLFVVLFLFLFVFNLSYYYQTPLSSSLLSSSPPPLLSSPCLSFPVSLSFLHHKHFQRWLTRVDNHPETSATTIMSTLSSHNNVRITCWRGRLAVLRGAGSQIHLD